MALDKTESIQDGCRSGNVIWSHYLFSKIALYFKLNHFKLIHLQANMLSSFIFTYFAGIVHTNQGQTYQFFVYNLTITWFQDRPCGYRSPRGNFVHYNFLKLHYIRHKIKDVSPLRVAALTCNIMLYTYPPPPPPQKKKNSIKRR